MSGALDVKTWMMENMLISEKMIHLNFLMQLSAQEEFTELNL
jgi:hypothetical protein